MIMAMCSVVLMVLVGCAMFSTVDNESTAYLAGQGIVAGYYAGKDKVSVTPEQTKMIEQVSSAFSQVIGVIGTADTANMKQSIADALRKNIKDDKQYALAQQFADVCWNLLNKNVDIQKLSSNDKVKVVMAFCNGINDGLIANK